jgi:glycerol-3-phosphate dehydrogenase (NAD(P)+)
MAAVTVLGAGMMGSALCVPLVDRGHEVRLVGTPLDRAIVARLQQDHHHLTLGCELPRAIRPMQIEQLPGAMEGCELLALGVSSAGVAWAGEAIRPFVRADLPVFGICKGLAWDGTRLRVLPDVLAEQFAEPLCSVVRPGAIAGPCIAGELARRVPTCVLLTGRDRASLERIAAAIRGDYYRVWLSDDVVGVEVCAALKNAFAMGVAFGAGLHERKGGAPGSVAMHNYESAVMAQAIVEMAHVVRALGGRPETAAGLAGVGDLDVTNNGGRTGRFGRLLGMGLSLPDAIERMSGATLECLEVLQVLRKATAAMRQQGLLGARDTPLLDELGRVALDGAELRMPFDEFFGGHGQDG